jgi:indole-3-glycerol phosphate synthase
VAELKRRSPSRGELRPDFEPVACALDYAEGGAAALSVLTDEHFFGGRLEYLAAVRAAVALPLLRKDFLIDAYQVDEARVAGADAVLLIVSALAPPALAALLGRARALGLDALVEVTDERELDAALSAGADLVGVNNRDLKTFVTDLTVTERLAPRVPASVLLVAESGIAGPADVARLARAGARAFLVGESLMRQPEPGRALRRLRDPSAT